MFYFYLVLLLLIFVLLFRGINLSINFAPAKIKLLSIFALSLLTIRYIAVFIFLMSNNIKYLYLLKFVVFLNSLCIPILAMISLYILARIDKLKLKYIIILSSLILLVYIFAVFTFKTNIELYRDLGYKMYFINNNLLDAIFLILNTAFFFSSIILLSYRITNKLGIRLTLASSFVVMLEIILKNIGISILPYFLIGDVFWIITTNYSLNKLKKS